MKWLFWTRLHPLDAADCAAIDPLLSLYADGMASPAEARAVESHLPDCADCRESLAWMQATQRALAARPVVTPPDDLRARIAGAIAAASAAPAGVPFTTRPARAFPLRSAYAAAASLAVLGVVSYGLLHPAPQVAVSPHPLPSKVAVLPPATVAPPANHPFAGPSVKPHGSTQAVRPARPAPTDLSRVADTADTPDVSAAPLEKAPVRAALPVKALPKPSSLTASAKPQPSPSKKPFLPEPKPQLTATTKAAENKIPVVKPQDHKPEFVATTVTPPAPVPVSVAPTIIRQDPAPTTTVASAQEPRAHTAGFLDVVNARAGELRRAALVGGKIPKEAMYATQTYALDGTARHVDLIHTP